MARILRNRVSVSDYEDIWNYIARDNPAAADRMIRELERHVSTLATMPGLGREEPRLAPNLRSFPVRSYLIFYRAVDDGIELVRVLHGARDINPDYFGET